jgi:transcriptional regulator of acetoin/glycerol metabolism
VGGTLLAAALERHDGRVSATARALDLHRQSLQKRLRALDLAREAPGEGPGAAK